MAIKAILFDKDGTLLDFSQTFLPALNHTITRLAGDDRVLRDRLSRLLMVDLENNAIAPHSPAVAESLEGIARVLAPTLGRKDIAALADELDVLALEGTEQSVTAFSYVHQTLEALRSDGFTLGVATNDSEQAAHQHLNTTGISHFVDFVAGYDSGHGAKPGPGMVTAFVSHCRLRPDNVMMVGDSIHDLMAGRAANVVSVGVICGTVGADVLAPYADFILPDISQLPALLKLLPSAAP
ncbi:MAG: HAD family hydrolase [Pseudomonadota bacterium]